MRFGVRSLGLLITSLSAIALLAACGSSSKKSDQPASNNAGNTSTVSTSVAARAGVVTTTTVLATSAAATRVAASHTATPIAPSPATQTGGSGGSSTSGTILTEIATDNKFSQTNYTIRAGQEYLLNLQNSGQAIHNWEVTDQKGADGKHITTIFTDPGKSSSVTFTIDKPGTYHFQCDIHPDEMKGTITVQP